MENTIDFITSSVKKACNTPWLVTNTKKIFAEIVLKNAIKKKRSVKIPTSETIGNEAGTIKTQSSNAESTSTASDATTSTTAPITQEE